MRYGNQNELYAKPWHSLIPGNRGLNTPEIIKQVNYAAGANRQTPAALANLINTESLWNPLTDLRRRPLWRDADTAEARSGKRAAGSAA